MAKRVANARLNVKKKKTKVEWNFPLKKNNFIIAGIGLATILLGYALMSTGLGGEYAQIDGTWNNPLAVSVSPIILVIGYCVIIPYSILKYYGTNEKK